MLPLEQAAAATQPPLPPPPPSQSTTPLLAPKIQEKKHAEKLAIPFSPGPSHFGTLLAF